MSTYDSDQKEKRSLLDRVSDDSLRRQTGINPEQEKAMEREAYSGAAEDIAKREAGESLDDSSNSSRAAKQEADDLSESTDDEPDGGGQDTESLFQDYKPGRFRGWSRNKKAAAGLGIGGVFTTMLLLVLGNTPLQLVHLSQILQTNNTENDSNHSVRLGRLLRFARTGEVGHTRLSARGSRSADQARRALREIGIDLRPGRIFGQLDDVLIDSRVFPGVQGVTDRAMVIRRIAEALDVPESAIQNLGQRADGSFKFRIAGNNSNAFTQNIIKRGLGKLDDGVISTAMKGRDLKVFFNAPSLLHPFKYIGSRLENRLGTRITQLTRARERYRNRAPPETPEARAARERVRRRLNPVRVGILTILTLTEGACKLHDVTDDMILLNRSRIVIPAVIEATDITSAGSQIVNGEDFDLIDISDTTESFIDDEGNSIWDAQALQATWGAENPTGQDITNENKQAFAGDTTAANVKKTIEDEIPFTDAVCSPLGQLIQVALGLITLFYSGGASATTSTFAKVISVGRFVGKTVATYILIDIIQNRLTEFLAEDPFFTLPPSGPLGGNMFAYGAREAANINARGSGGVALSERETALIDYQQQQIAKDEFRSQSFATRMFDVKDYRSLASVSMRKLSGSPVKNTANYVASMGNLSGLISNFSVILNPSASAVGSNYDWHMPRYGIPKGVQNNPDNEDPYDVGEAAADLLDRDEDFEYIEKAKTCFGVDIHQSSEGWDVDGVEDVNPATEDYTSANCDEDNRNWHKIMMFVGYSLDMQTLSCYDGTDESACDDLGFDAESEEGGTNGELPDDVVGEDEIVDIPGLTSGCHESIADNVRRMIEAAAADGVTLTGSCWRSNAQQIALRIAHGCAGDLIYSDDCTGSPPTAVPGTSNHERGLAIDFNNCHHGSACFIWLSEHADEYGLQNFSDEAWHWSVDGH